MKFKKVSVPGILQPPDTKSLTAKDVVMVRVTVEFPVLKVNYGSETIGDHLESAASDVMYPDKSDPKSVESWITVETSDVTLKELQAYAERTKQYYLYDPRTDNDIDITGMKK